MIARAAGREREMAIRVATGASRSRLIRQLLTESMILALVGGGLGLLLARWGVDLAVRGIQTQVPYYVHFGMNARVLVFGLLTSLLTGLAFGLLPALRASSPNLQDTLKEGALSTTASRSRNRMRAGLVVLEVALALVLLAGAGLMIRTFLRLNTIPSGYVAPEHVLLADLVLLDARFQDPAQVRATVDEVLQRIARLPGASAAIEHTEFVAGFGTADRRIAVEGMSDVPDGGSPRFYFSVTPGYFQSLGLRLVAGRGLDAQDGPGAPPVALVNESMAKRIWRGASPIGARIRLDASRRDAPWLTVAGVVSDVEGDTPGRPARSYAYVPFAQSPGRPARLQVRASDAMALLPSIRAELASLPTDLPLQDVRTLETDLRRGLWPVRFYAVALSSLAAFAALLAVLGIWGVIAYTVSLRTREIGIRVALGATRMRVLRMVAAEGAWLAGIGLGLGLAGAFALTRVIGVMLYGTSPIDPLVLSLVCLTFATVALIATLVPARRATRVDPMVALRTD